MNLLGIEIGGSKLQLVIGDEAGKISHRAKIEVDRAKGGAGIRDLISATIAEWRKEISWNAVGCGYGGPVDFQTGKICCSHHIAGWNDFPLGDWLREICGTPVAQTARPRGQTGGLPHEMPVRVDNDANTAALGEATFGAGGNFNPVFYTNSGSGVGGGLVVDGKIYHGAIPGEAELGHMRLDKSGTTVEDRCSGWAVDRKIRALKKSDPESLLAKLIGSATGCEAKYLPVALRLGDPMAQRIVNETADDLAFAISHAVHLFHPEAVVLGGGLSLIGEPWRAAVANALPNYLMKAFAPGPQVKLSALGEDAVPVGALALASAAAKG